MAVEQYSTTMVLKVDLQCFKCYKKVKKVLCKFPEIRDQVYDEKQNTVTIKVVCCCPEKLKQKIQCKGGKSIKSIMDIKPPPEKPIKDKPADTKPPGDKRKVTFADPPTKPKPKPQPQPQPQAQPKPKPAPLQLAPKPPEVIQAVYSIPIPFGVCGGEYYYEGRGGPCYGGYYGRPVYDSWGGGSRWSRCDYFTEENHSTCTIM